MAVSIVPADHPPKLRINRNGECSLHKPSRTICNANHKTIRAATSDVGIYTPDFLDRLARSRAARVALVNYNWVEFYGGNFHPVIPGNWLLAGVWKFHNRVVLAPPALSFYALDETA